jgi:hypothetical protein
MQARVDNLINHDESVLRRSKENILKAEKQKRKSVEKKG